MTQNKDFKILVRARMDKTGESYSAARLHLLPGRPEIDPPVQETNDWHSLLETTRKEAELLLARALKIEPRLTHFGLGIGDEMRRRRKAMLTGAGLDELEKEFRKQREGLQGALPEIAGSADWIRRQQGIASFNRRHSSYGYKHTVERWFRDRGDYLYVSNGSFIAAALGLGFDLRPSDPGSPNAYFRFSERTVKSPLDHPKPI